MSAAVPGMTCASPQAPAGDTACGLPPDSIKILMASRSAAGPWRSLASSRSGVQRVTVSGSHATATRWSGETVGVGGGGGTVGCRASCCCTAALLLCARKGHGVVGVLAAVSVADVPADEPGYSRGGEAG